MARKPSLSQQNRRLSAENGAMRAKAALLQRTIHNSLGDLAQGLSGGPADFGSGMSNLTSLNPTLQNNLYMPVTLMWQNLMFMYKSHGLIQTAIDMPVLDALRGGLELQSDGQLSADDLLELEAWLEESATWERVGDAFIWARLFGGGALVVNTESDSDKPLGDELMDGRIEFYDASRWELTAERRIPASGKYGFYGKTLDKSRVITVLGKRAPWLIRAQLADWGMSELERIIEDFNLFLRTRNVIYELLEDAKIDVYSLKGFAGQLASATGTALTQRRIQAMHQIKNFNNALILDKDDEYDQKTQSFSGLSDIMKENRMLIASALRMPMSRLFGLPSTGFSSGQDDLEVYNSLVESEVRQPMKQIVRKVLKIAVKHLFHDDLEVTFKFKPLRVLSGTDEENIKSSKSTRYLSLFEKQLMTSREVGEAMQKDNLVPVPLKAEQGLLDDHPAPDPEAGPPQAPPEVPAASALPDRPDASADRPERPIP